MSMSAKSVKRFKADLEALEIELFKCNGCESLKCEIRENCENNALKKVRT
jgi:hypothetical protein